MEVVSASAAVMLMSSSSRSTSASHPLILTILVSILLPDHPCSLFQTLLSCMMVVVMMTVAVVMTGKDPTTSDGLKTMSPHPHINIQLYRNVVPAS